MTDSQTCREWALDIIRRLDPADYQICLAREREADAIARNAATVELPDIEMHCEGSGPLAMWIPKEA
jgi:hypothetical protein